MFKFKRNEQSGDTAVLEKTECNPLQIVKQYLGDSDAVVLDNVSYSYNKSSKNPIYAVKDIDLKVVSGKIYALIGPSGCGKTTLVHCCVGCKKPTSGRVMVFGKKPGTPDSGVPGPVVGYMPQELALYLDFTIDETLKYFGRLYGLSEKYISSRGDELTDLLQLPKKSRLVGHLSGGQQRRVSFAVALLHNPKLLVVDEPTVGLDPILRRSIWMHLQKLTQKDNLSVIITTHYIEEARAADFVCFLRNGQLLTTNAPEKLIQRYSVNQLEDVFLELCLSMKSTNGPEDFDEIIMSDSKMIESNRSSVVRSDHKTAITEKSEQSIECTSNQPSSNNNDVITDIVKPPMASVKNMITSSTKFNRIYAMCRKNLIRLKHNLLVVLFQILMPTLSIILFCTCFGHDPHNIDIAIVNQDKGLLSKWFLESIDNATVNKINFASLNDSMDSMYNGNVWAILEFDRLFSDALDKRFQNSDTSSAVMNRSSVKLHLDWTNHIIASHVQKIAFESLMEFGKRYAQFYGQDESLTKPIIDLQKPVYGDKKQSLNEFMTPGNITVFIFFSAAASTALVCVMERKEGMLQRVLVAGVASHEFLISHLIQQIIILSGQIAIMFFFTFYVFHMMNNGSLLSVTLIVFAQGVCGMCYGLFISSISQQESHAFVLLMGSLLPNFLMSGFIWPLETMPKAIMLIGKCLPNAKAIESLRFIMYRGWSIENFEVFAGFGITAIWILIFLVIAINIFRKAKD